MDVFDLLVGASDEIVDAIESIDPQPDWYHGILGSDTQLIVNFKPDGRIQLSIIRGHYSYGGDEGLYEIALLQHSELDAGPFAEEWGDSVKGYLTENEVREYLRRAAEYAVKCHNTQ